MKLDRLAFATLIAFIAMKSKHMLEAGDIKDLDNLIDIKMPDVATDQVNPNRIDEMLAAISDNHKIEAIKAYRSLTGSGLKESKDAIEKYWLRQPL
jgi:ribosomal protein L7/L12